MSHTTHVSKYVNDPEVISILEKMGDYLDAIDIDRLKVKKGRQNRINVKEALCDNYREVFSKQVRPGPPWHQKICDLLLDLEQRKRDHYIADLATDLGKRITGRKQALSAIYPPGGYLAWHHNADVPGRNLIFTWSKTGEGVFRYFNNTKGYYFDIPDHKGWNVKSFDWYRHGITDREGYSWHCAGTECLRATVAFVIDDNQMSNEMLEDDFSLSSFNKGCFISKEDMADSNEWWDSVKDEIKSMKLNDDIKDELDKSPAGVKYGPR
tara:strand:+ start:114 stop:914 length:801 start_codon:yes stop_codon:yes gene_type:complete